MSYVNIRRCSSFRLLFVIILVGLLSVACGKSALLGVGALGDGGGGGGGLPKDATFAFDASDKQLTRVTGKGIALHTDMVEVATSGGVLQFTPSHIELRRGQSRWTSTFTDSDVSLYHNDALLTQYASDGSFYSFSGALQANDLSIRQNGQYDIIVTLCMADVVLTKQPNMELNGMEAKLRQDCTERYKKSKGSVSMLQALDIVSKFSFATARQMDTSMKIVSKAAGSLGAVNATVTALKLLVEAAGLKEEGRDKSITASLEALQRNVSVATQLLNNTLAAMHEETVAELAILAQHHQQLNQSSLTAIASLRNETVSVIETTMQPRMSALEASVAALSGLVDSLASNLSAILDDLPSIMNSTSALIDSNSADLREELAEQAAAGYANLTMTETRLNDAINRSSALTYEAVESSRRDFSSAVDLLKNETVMNIQEATSDLISRIASVNDASMWTMQESLNATVEAQAAVGRLELQALNSTLVDYIANVSAATNQSMDSMAGRVEELEGNLSVLAIELDASSSRAAAGFVAMETVVQNGINELALNMSSVMAKSNSILAKATGEVNATLGLLEAFFNATVQQQHSNLSQAVASVTEGYQADLTSLEKNLTQYIWETRDGLQAEQQLATTALTATAQALNLTQIEQSGFMLGQLSQLRNDSLSAVTQVNGSVTTALAAHVSVFEAFVNSSHSQHALLHQSILNSTATLLAIQEEGSANTTARIDALANESRLSVEALSENVTSQLQQLGATVAGAHSAMVQDMRSSAADLTSSISALNASASASVTAVWQALNASASESEARDAAQDIANSLAVARVDRNLTSLDLKYSDRLKSLMSDLSVNSTLAELAVQSSVSALDSRLSRRLNASAAASDAQFRATDVSLAQLNLSLTDSHRQLDANITAVHSDLLSQLVLLNASVSQQFSENGLNISLLNETYASAVLSIRREMAVTNQSHSLRLAETHTSLSTQIELAIAAQQEAHLNVRSALSTVNATLSEDSRAKATALTASLSAVNASLTSLNQEVRSNWTETAKATAATTARLDSAVVDLDHKITALSTATNESWTQLRSRVTSHAEEAERGRLALGVALSAAQSAADATAAALKVDISSLNKTSTQALTDLAATVTANKLHMEKSLNQSVLSLNSSIAVLQAVSAAQTTSLAGDVSKVRQEATANFSSVLLSLSAATSRLDTLNATDKAQESRLQQVLAEVHANNSRTIEAFSSQTSSLLSNFTVSHSVKFEAVHEKVGALVDKAAAADQKLEGLAVGAAVTSTSLQSLTTTVDKLDAHLLATDSRLSDTSASLAALSTAAALTNASLQGATVQLERTMADVSALQPLVQRVDQQQSQLDALQAERVTSLQLVQVFANHTNQKTDELKTVVDLVADRQKDSDRRLEQAGVDLSALHTLVTGSLEQKIKNGVDEATALRGEVRGLQQASSTTAGSLTYLTALWNSSLHQLDEARAQAQQSASLTHTVTALTEAVRSQFAGMEKRVVLLEEKATAQSIQLVEAQQKIIAQDSRIAALEDELRASRSKLATVDEMASLRKLVQEMQLSLLGHTGKVMEVVTASLSKT